MVVEVRSKMDRSGLALGSIRQELSLVNVECSWSRRIVFRAASDLLNRERSLKSRKMTVENVHAVLTPELLVAAAKCAREIMEDDEREKKTGRKSYEAHQWPQIDEEGSVIDTPPLNPWDPDSE